MGISARGGALYTIPRRSSMPTAPAAKRERAEEDSRCSGFGGCGGYRRGRGSYRCSRGPQVPVWPLRLQRMPARSAPAAAAAPGVAAPHAPRRTSAARAPMWPRKPAPMRARVPAPPRARPRRPCPADRGAPALRKPHRPDLAGPRYRPWPDRHPAKTRSSISRNAAARIQTRQVAPLKPEILRLRGIIDAQTASASSPRGERPKTAQSRGKFAASQRPSLW